MIRCNKTTRVNASINFWATRERWQKNRNCIIIEQRRARTIFFSTSPPPPQQWSSSLHSFLRQTRTLAIVYPFCRHISLLAEGNYFRIHSSYHIEMREHSIFFCIISASHEKLSEKKNHCHVCVLICYFVHTRHSLTSESARGNYFFLRRWPSTLISLIVKYLSDDFAAYQIDLIHITNNKWWCHNYSRFIIFIFIFTNYHNNTQLSLDGISSKIERRRRPKKKADPENINLMLIAIKWEFTSASILRAYHANS